MGYKERTINGYSKDNIDNIFKANEKLSFEIKNLKLENKYLKKDKKKLENEIKELKHFVSLLKEDVRIGKEIIGELEREVN